MSGINKVILVGNLGADPEVRVTSSGESVTTLSVATSEKWKDKQTGEPVDKTEWHRVVLWRRLAEIAGQYLRKGSTVYIEGKLTTRKWTDQSGQDRYTTEIQGNELQMLDGRPSDDSERPSDSRTQVSAQNRKPTSPHIDDDVPF